MKILYGVQATGNGHITRARTMASELEKVDIDVEYLFSGRPCDKLFNMEPFGAYRCLPGLTFTTEKGKIKYLKTAVNNNLLRFIKDIKSLDLSGYDLVITDFEPVTAWAARIKRVPCIAIGHQYAFKYNIPIAGSNPLARFIMKIFAPSRRSLGIHWHHFDSAILPPMIEPVNRKLSYETNKILVYLPFNDKDDVIAWLSVINDYDFYIYCDIDHAVDKDNIHLRPFSRQGFLDDLASCCGIVSNAGFELLSEGIQCGKKLLVMPLKGQMEQISNALAIKQLGYGDVMNHFDTERLKIWLSKSNPEPRSYPNVAASIVDWIKSGMSEDEALLSRKLWSQVTL
jgi:uncharacterized protein (TIGR00661 family)